MMTQRDIQGGENLMTEPKTVAGGVTEILPGLFHYRILDERIKSQSDSYALVAGGRVVLIDPLPLDPVQLGRLGTVEAIVLGTPSHQRSAWHLRRDHKAKVYAPEGSSGLEEKPDVTYKAGDALPLGLRALHAPGPAASHHVFHIAAKPGALLCTDILHVGSRGIEFLPEKYMNDAARARESVRRLMEIDFDILCFGHGDPITKDARTTIASVMEKDAAQRKGSA
jgi:glyoxylase-like metal-dependent hydrolase (beta-lactamase superfamily II)